MQRLFTIFLLVCLGSTGPAAAQRCGAVSPYGTKTITEEETVPRTSLVVPVAVHVVYADVAGNISDEQIYSQLAVLNADFRKGNDLSVVPEAFRDRMADLQIEFCLARRDPAGLATTGITRTETTETEIGRKTTVHYTAEGGADAWDPAHYLNVWVADMGPNQTGRASFPGEGPSAEDGVVIDPRYFGTTGLATAPYNLGRTTTHEIGHYFNLLHPWGPDPVRCAVDDGVEDTPISGQTFLFACPSEATASCDSPDMFSNYMNYTDDACMGQFTPGQKARVWQAIYTWRSGLLESKGCIPPDLTEEPTETEYLIAPNPGRGPFMLDASRFPGVRMELELFDAAGRLVWREHCSWQPTFFLDIPPGISNGLYFLRITAGGESRVKQMIILGDK